MCCRGNSITYIQSVLQSCYDPAPNPAKRGMEGSSSSNNNNNNNTAGAASSAEPSAVAFSPLLSQQAAEAEAARGSAVELTARSSAMSARPSRPFGLDQGEIDGQNNGTTSTTSRSTSRGTTISGGGGGGGRKREMWATNPSVFGSPSMAYLPSTIGVANDSTLSHWDTLPENRTMQPAIERLCASRLINNWHDEIRSRVRVAGYRDAGRINFVRKLFPYYHRYMSFYTSFTLLIASIIMVIYNCIAFSVYFERCQAADFTESGFILPILFLCYNLFYSFLWHGPPYRDCDYELCEDGESVRFRSFEFLMCEMLDYLIELDPELETKLETVYHFNETPLMRFFPYFTNALILILLLLNIVATARDLSNYCDRLALFGSFFFLSSFFPLFSCAMAMIFFLISFHKTSTVCSLLIQSWINRYVPIKRVVKRDLKYFMKHSQTPVDTYLHFSYLIRQDAYERYLLMNYYFSEISRLWSMPITFTLMFSIFGFVWYLYMAIEEKQTSALIYIIVFLFFLFFPMVNIVNANITINRLIRSLHLCLPPRSTSLEMLSIKNGAANTASNVAPAQGAAMMPFYGNFEEDLDEDLECLIRLDKIYRVEDFEIIGGRSEWLKYLEANPIYWTIYGLAITPLWLKTSVVGTFTILVASFLRYYSTQ